jgi:hypothetical protein
MDKYFEPNTGWPIGPMGWAIFLTTLIVLSVALFIVLSLPDLITGLWRS